MKTIKTDTHLLLVDETSEIIKEGDWFYSENERGIAKALRSIISSVETGNFKIIAASPKLGDLIIFNRNLED